MWSVKRCLLKFTLATLFLVLCTPSWSETSSENGAALDSHRSSLQQWNQYFGAHDFQDPVKDIGRFLKVARSCRAPVNWVVGQVAGYGAQVQASRKRPDLGIEAERTFLATKRFLVSMTKAHDSCAGAAVKAYYLASAVLAETGSPEDLGGFPYLRPLAMGPALVGVYLANSGHLEISADEPVFHTDAEHERPRRMLGDYDCNRSVVRFFPGQDLRNLLRPYDAGADFSLEEDHLLRDKNTPYDSILKHYSSPSHPKVDWNSYILDDETLALVLAASQERLQKYQDIGKRRFGGDGGTVTGHPATESKDFSFLRQGSDFDQVAQNQVPTSFDPSDAVFPREPSERETFRSDEDLVRRIESYSERVYFGISALDGRFDCHQPIPPVTVVASSEPQEDGQYLYREPLFPDYYWVGRGHFSGNALDPIPQADNQPHSDRHSGITSLFLENHLADSFIASGDPTVSSVANQYRTTNVGPFLSSLNDLNRKMSAPSEACREFGKAVRDGEVPPGYVGLPAQMSKKSTKPSGDGTKPSGDGTKPSGDDSQP